MISQSEFKSTIAKFEQFEPGRAPLYEMWLNLLKAGFEVEAYLLILATWNFAYFRYILTKFDLDAFKNVILSTSPTFEKLKSEDFQKCNLDEIQNGIKSIYAAFKKLVGQTGSSKIMHFKHPPLFVMWDTAIRRKYKIPNSASADDYIRFLKLMREKFGHIKWNSKEKALAKAIDEYNFVKVHEASKANPWKWNWGQISTFDT